MNFYLDFEATRFSNRIISIGCTNEKGAKFETLVKPEKGKVDNFITELTGITPEMVSDAPTADEAFNAFAEWAYANSENTTPKYFCYGDSDKDFIAATIRTMSDFKAITFAASIKALLIDYSSVVKEYLCTSSIALKKVVALIEETDETPIIVNRDSETPGYNDWRKTILMPGFSVTKSLYSERLSLGLAALSLIIVIFTFFLE